MLVSVTLLLKRPHFMSMNETDRIRVGQIILELIMLRDILPGNFKTAHSSSFNNKARFSKLIDV